MGDDPLFSPLVRRVGNARDGLRAAVLAAAVERVAALRRVPSDEVADGVASVVAALVKLLSGEPLSSTDRAQLRDVGRRWSARGVDGRAQAKAVTAASQVVQRRMRDAAESHRWARTRDRKAALEQIGDAVLAAASVVQQAVLADLAALNGSPPRQATLVDRILAAPPESWPAVEAEAAEAGLSGLFGLLALLPGDGGAGEVAKIAARVGDSHGALCGAVQPDPIPHVAVVVGVADQAAWTLAVKHVAVDVADAGCDLVAAPEPVAMAKLPITYKLCRSHLPYTAVLPSRSAAVDFSELRMCGLLAATEAVHRAEVFDAIAGGLVRRPDLVHLVDALVALGVYEEVEAAMGKPYRSITHAVKVIKTLTGHDWNDPRGRYLLTFATHLRWLEAMSLGEFDVDVWGPVPHFARLGRAR